MFAKAADPAHKAMIRMTSGMFHEPRLFTCGAPLPLEHPIVYAALIDEADYDFVMIMEDLTARGADPRDGTRPMTVEQVATGVRGLARMHGKYWGERVSAIRRWAGSNRSCLGAGWNSRRCPPRSNASATTPLPK